MRAFIDTNIIMDILQKREPFFAEPYRVLRMAVESNAECLLSASAATSIFDRTEVFFCLFIVRMTRASRHLRRLTNPY